MKDEGGRMKIFAKAKVNEGGKGFILHPFDYAQDRPSEFILSNATLTRRVESVHSVNPGY
jgi:hypothetical protein